MTARTECLCILKPLYDVESICRSKAAMLASISEKYECTARKRRGELRNLITEHDRISFSIL